MMDEFYTVFCDAKAQLQLCLCIIPKVLKLNIERVSIVDINTNLFNVTLL